MWTVAIVFIMTLLPSRELALAEPHSIHLGKLHQVLLRELCNFPVRVVG